MEIQVCDALERVNDQLGKGGLFLVSGGIDQPNVMTIGWGGITRFYNQTVFIAPVRHSRYSHHLIEENGCYTICVPLHPMKEELSFAGTKSGRDTDKFLGHGMTAQAGKAVASPIVAECELHLECRVIGRTELDPSQLKQEVLDRWYGDKDMHTLFLGEVVRCYLTK